MLGEIRERILSASGETFTLVILLLVGGGILLWEHTIRTNGRDWRAAWAEEFVRSSASPLRHGAEFDVGGWLPPSTFAAGPGRYLHLVIPSSGAARACTIARSLNRSGERIASPRHVTIAIGAGDPGACDVGYALVSVSEARAAREGIYEQLGSTRYVILDPRRRVIYSRRSLPSSERLDALHRLLEPTGPAAPARPVRPPPGAKGGTSR